MKICGPKLSLCGLIISVWGIFQLILMGIFYYVKSVALAEDLPGLEENFKTADEFYAKADIGYTQVKYPTRSAEDGEIEVRISVG
uniref:Uncharacterized protein n=1 Tax=Timema douglasi TaxID=61478 RepID=A0A7R8VKN6_TIMDO|nr:unnamed protein product [Timema douglasi]